MPVASRADVLGARRILVYGVTGAGKTTAATRLGARLGLPVHLADEEFGWLPGWVERPRPEQRALVEAVVAAEDAWIFDTAYSHWSDVVRARTDVVVALDYPRWLSFGRLLRRTAHRLVTRREMCNGNVETLAQTLSRNSILRWHVRSFARKRQRIRGWATASDGVKVFVARWPRDLERLLADAQRSSVDRKAASAE